ncbi:MAG: hypothetical protein ACLT98_12430 [Eggerthellaceae bacterium]
MVEELREQTSERYGAMPQACANMFAKSLVRLGERARRQARRRVGGQS